MAKGLLAGFAKNVKTTVAAHSPEILTGLGITGMIAATVLAVKATPKAMELIEEEKRRQNRELREEAEDRGYENFSKVDTLTPKETIKVAWKVYIPTAITCVASAACLIGANSVSARRTAALATAYKLSEKALSEFHEAVTETIGDSGAEEIREKVNENRLKKDPVSAKQVIITGNGDVRCYETITGQYFDSSRESIRAAINTLNQRMMNEMYVSLNEFFYELDMEGSKGGDQLGWNIDDGLIEVHFDSRIADDGTPCLVIEYEKAPKYKFYNFV